jgi:hypothetical protein
MIEHGIGQRSRLAIRMSVMRSWEGRELVMTFCSSDAVSVIESPFIFENVLYRRLCNYHFVSGNPQLSGDELSQVSGVLNE